MPHRLIRGPIVRHAHPILLLFVRLSPAFTSTAGGVENRDGVRAIPTPANCKRPPLGLWNGIAKQTDDTQATRAMGCHGLLPKLHPGSGRASGVRVQGDVEWQFIRLFRLFLANRSSILPQHPIGIIPAFILVLAFVQTWASDCNQSQDCLTGTYG